MEGAIKLLQEHLRSHEQEKRAWEQERQQLKLRIAELEGELEVARSFSSSESEIPSSAAEESEPQGNSILAKYLKQFGLLGYGNNEDEDDRGNVVGEPESPAQIPLPEMSVPDLAEPSGDAGRSNTATTRYSLDSYGTPAPDEDTPESPPSSSDAEADGMYDYEQAFADEVSPDSDSPVSDDDSPEPEAPADPRPSKPAKPTSLTDKFARVAAAKPPEHLVDEYAMALAQSFPPHLDAIRCISVGMRCGASQRPSPVVLFGSEDGLVSLHNSGHTGYGRHSRVNLRGAMGPVLSCAITSPDINMCCVGGANGHVYVWEIADAENEGGETMPTLWPCGVLKGHKDAVWDVAAHPLQPLVMSLSGGEDCCVRLWNLQEALGAGASDDSATVLSDLAVSGKPTSGVFSPLNLEACAISYNGDDGCKVATFDTNTGKLTGIMTSSSKTYKSSQSSGRMRRWASSRMKRDATDDDDDNSDSCPFQLAAHPSENLYLTGQGDGSVMFWDPRVGHCVFKKENAHVEAVTSLSFHPEGEVLATASHEGRVCLWSLKHWGAPICRTPPRLHQAKGKEMIHKIAFDFATPNLFTCGADGFVHVLSVGDEGDY